MSESLSINKLHRDEMAGAASMQKIVIVSDDG